MYLLFAVFMSHSLTRDTHVFCWSDTLFLTIDLRKCSISSTPKAGVVFFRSDPVTSSAYTVATRLRGENKVLPYSDPREGKWWYVYVGVALSNAIV